MLHVLTKDGRKLFSGTKHEVKLWLRKNAIKNYVLKEHFVEKKHPPFEVPEIVEEEENLDWNFDD